MLTPFWRVDRSLVKADVYPGSWVYTISISAQFSARRGELNAGTRQFVPQGNKRAREDGADNANVGGNADGKRMRGGGHTPGS
jgi:hypothetical protein